MPATIAVLDGEPRIGLTTPRSTRLASAEDMAKFSVRDLAAVVARGGDGATTVAATAHLARAAGIGVFATGGLGGVHREARDTCDESADLTALARTAAVVVCAGVKSILDVAATLERLESLSHRPRLPDDRSPASTSPTPATRRLVGRRPPRSPR